MAGCLYSLMQTWEDVWANSRVYMNPSTGEGLFWICPKLHQVFCIRLCGHKAFIFYFYCKNKATKIYITWHHTWYKMARHPIRDKCTLSDYKHSQLSGMLSLGENLSKLSDSPYGLAHSSWLCPSPARTFGHRDWISWMWLNDLMEGRSQSCIVLLLEGDTVSQSWPWSCIDWFYFVKLT